MSLRNNPKVDYRALHEGRQVEAQVIVHQSDNNVDIPVIMEHQPTADADNDADAELTMDDLNQAREELAREEARATLLLEIFATLDNLGNNV